MYCVLVTQDNIDNTKSTCINNHNQNIKNGTKSSPTHKEEGTQVVFKTNKNGNKPEITITTELTEHKSTRSRLRIDTEATMV